MLKPTFVDPTITETPEQICWHNLAVADKYLNLQFFIAASIGWIKMNPTKNYQDLEKELRDRDFNTHLLACKPKSVPNSHLGLYRENDLTTYSYECIFSCRPKEHAIKELLGHWPSYEINFKNLSRSGSIIVNDVTNIDNADKDTHMLSENEKSNTSLISENKKKLIITIDSAEKFLSDLISTCEEKYKQKPIEKIVGLAPSGEPIFGLFVDDKLVADIGFIIEYNAKKEQVMRLFDLKRLF